MICQICKSKKTTKYSVKEMMFGMGDEFTYYQCSECETLQIESVPDNIPDYYPNNYYSYGVEGATSSLKKFLRKMRNSYAVSGNNLIGRALYQRKPDLALHSLKRIGINKSCRLLDVGCGSGYFIKDLMELGFQNLVGIDPYNEKDLNFSESVSVLKKDIFQTEGSWDVITLHHSFEHMENPEDTLRSLKEKLAPDGTVVIRIPIADSYAWQEYRVDWVQLDAPRHIFLHSQKSMEILAAKSGLVVEHVTHDSWDFQFWGSEQYRKGIPLVGSSSHRDNPESSIFSSERIQEFKKRTKDLNAQGRGDQAVFYLKHQTT